MEYWNGGILVAEERKWFGLWTHYSMTPSFQYSSYLNSFCLFELFDFFFWITDLLQDLHRMFTPWRGGERISKGYWDDLMGFPTWRIFPSTGCSYSINIFRCRTCGCWKTSSRVKMGSQHASTFLKKSIHSFWGFVLKRSWISLMSWSLSSPR